MKSYHFGGRLGDLIHGLIIPRYIYDTTGEKARIYISDIGDKFTAGIERTYRELAPIMDAQPFVESFEGYNGQAVDYNMWMFRLYPRINEECWTDTYFNTFLPGQRPPYNYKWLDWPGDNMENGVLVVGRNYVLEASTARYGEIQLEWDGPVGPLNLESISAMFADIATCTCFLGDQSAPMAIASALGKRRIVEVNRMKAHYEHEAKHTDRITWFHHGYVPDEITR